MALLQIEQLSKNFGGLLAVSELNLSLEKGVLQGLIGPNGAGKTTVFNLITGVYKPSQGRLIYNGCDITGMKSYQITQMGIARTFQNIRLFGRQTVLDNIKVAFNYQTNYGFFGALTHLGRFNDREKTLTDRAMQLLEVFHLEAKCDLLAKNLPYGEQRRLEIARALATRPQLLLLDEPAAGMNPSEVDNLIQLIRWVKNEFDLTILLIEHQLKVVMTLCESVQVMDFGQTIAEGTPDEVVSNPRVIEAYLGEEEGEGDADAGA